MLLEKATPEATHSSLDSSLIGVELLHVALAMSATDIVRLDGRLRKSADERLWERDDSDDFFKSDRLLEEVLFLDSDSLEILC